MDVKNLNFGKFIRYQAYQHMQLNFSGGYVALKMRGNYYSMRRFRLVRRSGWKLWLISQHSFGYDDDQAIFRQQKSWHILKGGLKGGIFYSVSQEYGCCKAFPVPVEREPAR